MFFRCVSFRYSLDNWIFSKSCSKPSINGKSFEKHNEICNFTKDRLLYFIENYNENKDEKSKYILIKYTKQFREFDEDKFNSIMDELKSKSNSGKEFFDEIS